jgi:hypothetical protein
VTVTFRVIRRGFGFGSGFVVALDLKFSSEHIDI